MKVLVAYESKYGATEGIATRIGEVLTQNGLTAVVTRARGVKDVSAYDAFVIGSAVFIGSWMREATDFVKRQAGDFGDRPVWLFSSGPIGTDTIDAQGRDVKVSSIPKTLAELEKIVTPREHRVFFGALDRKALHFPDSIVMGMPAFAKYDGDYRDWDDVTRWAESIAQALALPTSVA